MRSPACQYANSGSVPIDDLVRPGTPKELGTGRRNANAQNMATRIKILQPGDEHVLMNVAAGVFDNPIDAKLTKEFLEDPRHHIAVAIDHGKVVGFASGVHYIHPDKPPELWTNEVGVAPTHQRRRLGKAVLRALFEVGKSCNCTAAWVLTLRSNPNAVALYSSVGGIEGCEGGLGISDDIVGFSFALGSTRTPSPN
jgi:ribosomal protein S18 acetylase RimI-like enzyme